MSNINELRFGELGQGLGELAENLTFGETFVWDLTGPNSTDEDCAFCDTPAQERIVSPFDIAIPLASGQIALKAALGMMRPGYMLSVTREHVTSFAQVSKPVLTEIDRAFTDTEAKLSTALGCNGYIRLEHGSDNLDSCQLGAGACVAHAHQHLIPATDTTADLMLGTDMNWTELSEYSELSDLKGDPYLYVGHSGKHYAVTNPKIRSQWGRRIIAEEDGHRDWDWALFSGSVNLLQTWISLGVLPQGRMRVSLNPEGESRAKFEPRNGRRGEGIYK